MSGTQPSIAADASAAQEHDSVILLAHLPSIAQHTHLAPAIAAAAHRARSRLTIVLLSPQFDGSALPPATRATVPGGLEDFGAEAPAPPAALPHVGAWRAVERLLVSAYVCASGAAQARGRVLLDTDVLLRGTDAPQLGAAELGERAFDLRLAVEGDDLPIELPPELASLPAEVLPRGEAGPNDAAVDVDTDLPALYPVTALGGTFDHLHAGHKILLSIAAWIARDKLIIGLTDDTLLKNKANKHVLEDFATRSARVSGFLNAFRPGLLLDPVPISDVAGPTGWDPNIQALVVSRETIAGGAAVDKIREDKGLPPLRTFVIDVISATEARVEGADAAALRDAKLSSTFIRQWIVDQGLA